MNLSIGPVERGIMPKRYPDEFRRKVLDLVAAGRPIKHVAEDLGISIESIYQWRKQDRIDRGLVPGSTSVEKAELVAARRWIRELEDDVAILKRAREFLKEPRDPKGDSRPSM